MKSQNTAIGVIILGIGALLLLKRSPTGTVTTWESFDLTPYGGPIVYPAEIKAMGQAIARAEGFYVAGSIPQQAHNPGDLKIPGSPNTINGITVFDSDDAGWTALYRQLMLIVTGQSNIYNLDMSIADMARYWTATQSSAWAANVAGALGVDTSAKLWAVIV